MRTVIFLIAGKLNCAAFKPHVGYPPKIQSSLLISGLSYNTTFNK
jgi:hypothetical protein